MIHRLVPWLLVCLLLSCAGRADAALGLPWFVMPVPDVGPASRAKSPAPSSAESSPVRGGAEEVRAGSEEADGAVFGGPTLPSRRVEREAEVVAIGSSAVVPSGTTVSTAVSVFGPLRVDGTVLGDAVAVLGSMTIHGMVQGDVVCVFGKLTLGPEAYVGGNVIHPFGPASIDPGARIVGERLVRVLEGIGGLEALPSFLLDGLLRGRVLVPEERWTWLLSGGALILYVLTALLLRKPLQAVADTAEDRAATALAVGFVVAVLAGPILFLLIASLFGLVAVPFLVAGLLFASWMGRVAVCVCVSRQLGMRGMSPVIQVVPGFLLLLPIYMVPVVGLVSWMLVGLFGTGAATLAVLAAIGRERAVVGAANRPPSAGGERGVDSGALTHESVQASSVVGMASPLPDPSAGLIAEGPNQPPTAASPAAEAARSRAGFGARVLTFLVDLILVSAVSVFVWDGAFFVPSFLAYCIVFWGWKGTTIGGAVLRLRVRRSDGSRLGWDMAFVRGVGLLVSALPLGLGFLWAAWSEEHLTWHDNIAGTEVVRVPAGTRMI